MVKFTAKDYRENFINGELNYNVKMPQDNLKHQYHDMVFKELLDDKIEFIKFMKKYFGCELEEVKLEKYNRKFNTKLDFNVREADIIYKVKDREIFILVEHQSTVAYNMPERIVEYCIAIINSRALKQNRWRKYPIIYPIVLSTAKKKWDASLTIVQEQNEYYGFPKLEYPKYNLIDIHSYTIEELLKERTGISLAMAFEKIKTEEEMLKVTKILKNIELNKQERKSLYYILKYSGKIQKYLGKEGILEYKNILRRGEKGDMENFEKTYIKFLKDNYKRGKIDGINKGREETIKEMIKEMIKAKMEDDDIIKITSISKEKLGKLKLQVR